MYLRVAPGFGEPAQASRTAVDNAIDAAKRQMKIEADLQEKKAAMAGRGNSGIEARQHIRNYWLWSDEANFLENLKAVLENQSGVPLDYTSYPVTKSDAQGKSGRTTPWRFTPQRQTFLQSEADGSFCLGSARGMGFRTLFGLTRPSNREILKDLNDKILAAKGKGQTQEEARLLISRIVTHLDDPGSLSQYNQDLADRYDIKNVKVISADRAAAEKALKAGAPVMADLEGGWHWVLVRQSPRGVLWASDPLFGGSIQQIKWGELGTRFEIIVDSTTGAPITTLNSGQFQR